MDFITKLPRTSSGHDSIWVINDRLTKSAHFLAIREDYKVEKLACIYTDEIISRHGTPVDIISDRDARFTSRLWQTFRRSNRAYYPNLRGYASVLRNRFWWQLGFALTIGRILVQ